MEWVAISYSRGSSPSGNQTQVPVSPALADGFFTTAPGRPNEGGLLYPAYNQLNYVPCACTIENETLKLKKKRKKETHGFINGCSP